jgi:hypothetical protein
MVGQAGWGLISKVQIVSAGEVDTGDNDMLRMRYSNGKVGRKK